MNFELFTPELQANLLPGDGVVEDFGLILSSEQSARYLHYFLAHMAWRPDQVTLFGRHYVTGRKVVWYGDDDYHYHYSGSAKQAQAWLLGLLRLKQHVEHLVGHHFNSCLANLYEDGTQAVGWHSDDEPALYQAGSRESVIASLSLGATRKMSFKHKTGGETVDLLLQSGQLIVMRGQTQQYWKHCIRKSSKVLQPRINLTFRYFYA
jgi:alkylated DNA repair dioxygenase AlkB